MSRKHHTEQTIHQAALSLKNTIDSNPLSRTSFQELLSDVDIGRKRLLTVFKKITGYNFIGYQRNKRMGHAANMLLAGMTVKEVTVECGYNAYVGNFSRDFKAIFKKAPDEWLKKQAGNELTTKTDMRKDNC
jgi:transcriptional regulator GlxA family with amidase domain